MTSNQRRKHLAIALLLCWAVGSKCIAVDDVEDSIDTLEPIVRLSPARTDTSDDLFGYSAILHQVAEPTDFASAIQSARIIVGAPKGTFPGGLTSLVTAGSAAENDTGLVYQCSLSDEMCSAVGRDGTNPANRRLFDDQPDNTDLQTNSVTIMEQKSGQLMGQFLKSSGDYFIACAPRWITVRDSSFLDDRRSIGHCFMSGRNLSEFLEVRPCLGSDENANIIGRENRCQAGFGTLLYDDGTQTRLVVSAPGTFTGIGQLYQYDNVSTLTTTISPANQVWSGPRTSDARTDGGLSDRAAAYYDGFSITTGDLQGVNGVDSYITGMPRFNFDELRGRVNVRNTNLMDFTSPPILLGDQPGEYFGHVVATADLNGDGFDEIIVGAPLYSRVTPAEAEVGRVFVHVNDEGSFSDPPIILTGGSPNGRFGHSIINLGDINGDDIDDIAISAPYEATGDPDATGVVYIYYGNDINVIDSNPSQRINSNDIRTEAELSSLRTFGFSLSSEVDVDFNSYSDLVVGAYDSQAAVLFRTRSVAMVNFQLNTSSDTVDLITDSGFNVTVCATYNGRGLENRPLNVSYTLSELSQMNAFRVLQPAGGYNGVLQFPNTNVEACNTITIELRPIRGTDGQALRDPITIQVQFNRIPRNNRTSPTDVTDFRDFPLIRRNGNPIVQIQPTLSCGSMVSGSEVCKPDLSVSVTSVSYGAGVNQSAIVAGSVGVVRLVVNVRNLADEPAFNAMLNFSLPSAVFLDSEVISGQGVTCEGTQDFVCSLPTYIEAQNGPGGFDEFDITFEWTVNSSAVTGNEDAVTATFIVGLPFGSVDKENVTSNNQASVNLVFTAITNPQVTLNVVGPQTYSITPPPANIEMSSDLGPTVGITARISNTGPSTIPRARLEISVPVNVTNTGRFYLYISSLTATSENVVCDMQRVDPNDLNPQTRRRRSPVHRSKRQASQRSGTISQSCDFSGPPNPACETFSCEISRFDSQQLTVTIDAVLDSRFYQSQTASFSFTPFARISALDGFERFDMNPANNIAEDTYMVNAPVIDDLNLEIWLPIVGAVIALIIIIVIFIFLIFCGFFRKKRLEKAKKEAEAEFEVRQVPPEQPAVISGEDKKEEAFGEEVGMSKSDDDHPEIGDASDLQDGNGVGENGPTADGGEPEKDPEETSL